MKRDVYESITTKIVEVCGEEHKDLAVSIITLISTDLFQAKEKIRIFEGAMEQVSEVVRTWEDTDARGDHRIRQAEPVDK